MQYRQAMSRIPWAILTKFCVAEGFLGPFSSAKFQHYRYSNVGLSSLESQKFLIFFCEKNLPLRDESPWTIFIYKIRRGREFQVHPSLQSFTIVALEMSAKVRQNPQNTDFFVINLPLRDQSNPLKRLFF